MTKQELNILVERLIRIRDNYDLSRDDRDALADACNVIYDSINKIAEDEKIIIDISEEVINKVNSEHGNLVDINDVATALIYSGICDSAKCGEVKEVLSMIPIIVEGSAE